jgi:hypothetical protein
MLKFLLDASIIDLNVLKIKNNIYKHLIYAI